MSTAICYNLVYNSSTSAFEKHGLDTITSATFTLDGITGISGTCTSGHYLYFELDGINTIDDLNVSADIAVTSANIDFDVEVTSAVQSTSGTPNIENININEVNEMKVKLVIKAISPVIKGDYKPILKIKSSAVVTR